LDTGGRNSVIKGADVKGCIVIWWLVTAMAAMGDAVAADGAAIVYERCASCHALDLDADTYKMLLRDGPPLVNAGAKFRRDWLVAWLQAPTRIRPAGYLPFRFTIAEASGDRIDGSRLPKHSILTSDDAEAVAEWFWSRARRSAKASINAGLEEVSGQLSFEKVLGCGGCHRRTSDGGLSGPELGSAAMRLSENWLSEFLTKSSEWSPTYMPKMTMRPAQVVAVVGFIQSAAPRESSYDAQSVGQSVSSGGVPTERPVMLYQVYCSQCHGISGNGKGINAPYLLVAPRNHTSQEEMGHVTDEDIFTAIKFGGTAVGKSALMPSWSETLSDEDIRLLVAYVRSLSAKGKS
jgi:mono/diheme cytochrome c family protein